MSVVNKAYYLFVFAKFISCKYEFGRDVSGDKRTSNFILSNYFAIGVPGSDEML